MSSTSRDIPVLNGIRGLAVLIVFASHASNIFFQGALIGWGGGQLGVMLFFMLSGFLMAHLYVSSPASAFAQRQFLLNRFARIYPMFAFVVITCFAVHALDAPIWVYEIKSVWDVLVNLTFVQGYNVLWTIGPEVIFYALFLVLWKIGRHSKISLILTIIAMAAIAWAPLSVAPTNSLFALHGKLQYFLVGCLLGIWSETLVSADLSRKTWAQVAFWICMTVFVVSFPQIIRLFVAVPKRLTGDPWPDPWSFPFYLVVTTGLFVASIIARPWVFTNKIAGFIGKISFSFYLLHFAVLTNVHPLMPTHPLRSIALSLVITIALSSLTYFVIEVPTRNAIRRLGAGQLNQNASPRLRTPCKKSAVALRQPRAHSRPDPWIR